MTKEAVLRVVGREEKSDRKRALEAALSQIDRAFGKGSVMKLGTTELNLRMQKFAMELLGPYSQFEYRAAGAIDRGKWSHRMLAARRGTIAAGTNEIQHNIIGERVLGLPKG